MLTPNPFLHDVNRGFAEPVGAFVFAFGHLEHKLDEAIGSLLRIESFRESDAITAQIQSIVAKARLVQQLVKMRTDDPKTRAESERVAVEIARINTFRNRLLHGSWGAYFHGGDEEPYWQKLTLNPQNFKTKAFNVTVSEIKSNTKAALHATSDVANVAHGITKVPIGGRSP